MKYWAFALLLACLCGGFIYGCTHLPWWCCLCAGALCVWILNLIFIFAIRMTDKKHKNESDDSVDKDDISEMTNVCNRVLSMKLAPSLVEGINGGRIDIQVLETKEYFKNYLYRLFGEKASGYASQLRLERVQLAKHPEVRLWLLHTPSKREIGQTAIIGFIYSEKSGMAAFSLEHSLNDSLTICEWGEGKHFYYDKVENKDQFVKAIVLLMSGEQVGN